MKIFRGERIKQHDIIIIGKKQCILKGRLQQGADQCFDCALNNSKACLGFPCNDFYPKEIEGGL